MVLIFSSILACAAVCLLALRPDSTAVAIGIVGAASIDVALGAPLGGALWTVAPVLVFLTAALTLASLAHDSGLAVRGAATLVRWSRGNSLVLYALVCSVCAVATGIV